MKLFNSSKHGQELIIVAGIIVLALGFVTLKNYREKLYEPGQNACVADCTQVGGNFRRYNHNILSADQCICLIDEKIDNIWN